ncbi:unnamed protein product [Lathyrus sativus]|nr:unnamed protein product [Lathyrus sativus]
MIPRVLCFSKNKGISKLVKGVNSLFITLVSKVDNSVKLFEFRSISLVGSMNKVLVRLFANRLKKVIYKVVAKSQFAFLEGRQIEDCILIANELVDIAKRRKREAMLFKADFEKAFDSVD